MQIILDMIGYNAEIMMQVSMFEAANQNLEVEK